jgi:unsaturated rhamnogalacturonyl hydrolase
MTPQHWPVIVLALASALSLFAQSAAAQDTRPTGPAPNYPIQYQAPTVQQIADVLQRVRMRIDARSIIGGPADNLPTTEPDFAQSQHEPRWTLVSYPMGVIYAGMLAAFDATGDKTFADFDAHRFQYFADQLAKPDNPAVAHGSLRYLLAPTSLDACGAIGSAFIKARREKIGPDLKPVIDRFAAYISHSQFRLPDGTLARSRPFPGSIWADDTYMSVPFLAQMGALTGSGDYFDDGAKQITQFSARLFVPSAGLFTHGWHQSNPDDQPHYFWGRANGWCVMATVELLSVLPEDHPRRADLIKLLRAAAQGLASTQSGEGLWHQLLDRPDSYLETSCSEMFAFSLARAVNRGWLDGPTYAPVALAGWNGVASRIDSDGHITGTCVGTGYAADDVYYYSRPAIDDIHGYGPALLAGSEIILLLKNDHFRIIANPRAPILFIERK